MADDNPSILSHVSVGSNDVDRAAAFYDKVLAPLGCKRVMSFPGAAAYGKAFPEFWVQTPSDGGKPQTANGVHVAFIAPDKAAVDAFYAAAMELGATDDGKPGPRPQYGDAYYAAFVRDLDGHKIEAMWWDETKEALGHGG